MSSRKAPLRYSIFVISMLVLAVVVIFIARHIESLAPETSQGTIGPVEKYSSVQMTERDIKIRNAFLSDGGSLTRFLDQLRMMKILAEKITNDLNIWGDDLSAVATKMQVKVLRRGYTVEQKIRDYREYAQYIRENISIIDSTLFMLQKFAEKDTAQYHFEVERILNTFENFRIRFSEKFRNTMLDVPDVHNILIRNGLASIFCGNSRLQLSFGCSPSVNFVEATPLPANLPLGSKVYVGLYNSNISSMLNNKDLLGFAGGHLMQIELVESGPLGLCLSGGGLFDKYLGYAIR